MSTDAYLGDDDDDDSSLCLLAYNLQLSAACGEGLLSLMLLTFFTCDWPL